MRTDIGSPVTSGRIDAIASGRADAFASGRTDAFASGRTDAFASGRIDQIASEAWVVLEMHFLSRPHLVEEAREKLCGCLTELKAEGIADPRALKDRACRTVQMAFGPAPALSDDLQPPAGTPREGLS